MLSIVEKASRFTPDFGSGVVVVESNYGEGEFARAIDELSSMAARNTAIGFAAAQGMSDPRLNGMHQHPYPINSKGYSLEIVRGANGEALLPVHPDMQPARYRIDVSLTRRPL